MEKGSEVLKRAKSKSEQIEKKGDKVTASTLYPSQFMDMFLFYFS